MSRVMTKEEFVARFKKDKEKKNRRRQRDLDGAMAVLLKSTTGKSKNIGNSTKRYSTYGGL